MNGVYILAAILGGILATIVMELTAILATYICLKICECIRRK